MNDKNYKALAEHIFFVQSISAGASTRIHYFDPNLPAENQITSTWVKKSFREVATECLFPVFFCKENPAIGWALNPNMHFSYYPYETCDIEGVAWQHYAPGYFDGSPVKGSGKSYPLQLVDSAHFSGKSILEVTKSKASVDKTSIREYEAVEPGTGTVIQFLEGRDIGFFAPVPIAAIKNMRVLIGGPRF